jgi:xanthine/CO dehydrogenase XdhC/CoxF family maturation factor
MREIKAIVDQYLDPATAGLRKALATVVHVQGSSYRRPGARMLVLEDGRITGAISGGCLENDALRKAQIAMATNEPRLVVYDTSNEEDASFGVQLGCNGVITVLFEPVANENDSKINLLRQITESRHPAIAVTIFHDEKKYPHPGTCMVFGNKIQSLNLLPEETESQIKIHAHELLEEKKSAHTKIQNHQGVQLNCFLEFIPPPVSIIIAGAGNDAIPLVQLAEVLGWESQIVDGRHTHLSAEKFPPSCSLHLAAPEQVLEKINPDPWTAFILVTHNFKYDKALLKYLLPLQIPYIGILGPKKKMERMIMELKQEGADLSEEMMQKIHGPVGLEIGAEHPSEIALSIIAEIQAVTNNKTGGFLKNKNAVIHG